MNKLKIFWKELCPNCALAKKIGEKCLESGKIVEYYNVEEASGLAEGSFYNVLSTPSLVVTDSKDNHIHSWYGKVPSHEEIIIKME